MDVHTVVVEEDAGRGGLCSKCDEILSGIFGAAQSNAQHVEALLSVVGEEDSSRSMVESDWEEGLNVVIEEETGERVNLGSKEVFCEEEERRDSAVLEESSDR